MMAEKNKKSEMQTIDDDELPLVLVVDDDEICQQFIIKQLNEQKLFVKCKTAENVNQAVKLIEEQIAKEENFDIIFLDMFLKDNQLGTELLQIIKEKKWLQHALVIVMSGTEDANVVEQCYEYKIQNFIKKPISILNFKNEMIKVRIKYLENLVCPIKTYKLLGRLGEGMSGKVDLVRDKKTKTKYAMKTIKLVEDENGSSKQFEELFFNKGMKFPTVINLKEFVQDKSNLYLILEYAEFGTLNDVIKKYEIKKEYIPDDLIIDWITEVLLGLFNIHEVGLMHRDIKTDNLLLCKHRLVKIGDFGVARALGEGARAGTMVGTPFYIAPEIFLGQQYGMKIDIWSVGVVLFELMTNQLPFKGFDTEEIKKKVIELKYDMELIPKTRNPDLIKLMKQMLTLDPERRLSSSNALKVKLVNDNLKSLIERQLIEIDEELLLKLSKISSKFAEPKIDIEDKKTLTDYFNHIEQALKIDSNAIKTSYKPGFFKSRINNVISGSNFEILQKDMNFSKQQIEELIKHQLILNILNPDLKEFDSSDTSYYQVNIDDNPNVDNSIRYPLDQVVEDPILLSISCLKMAENIHNDIAELDVDEALENNEIKSKIASSKDYLEFLLEIRKLNIMKFDKCSKDAKTLIILNIYLTMVKHYQIKSFLFFDNSEGPSTILDSLYSLFFTHKKKTDIVYKINGITISLHELKHIVIRRNKKPMENWFRLTSSSDPRLNFLSENNPSTLMKFLLICPEPIENLTEYLIDFTPFEDTNKLTDQIEKRCQKFFLDNVKMDDNEIFIPKYMLNYLNDFGGNEVDLLKFLLKFNTDQDLKLLTVIKAYNDKSLKINYF